MPCAADHYGRKGFEHAPYPQKNFLLEALQQLRQLDYSDITSSGSDIPARIRARKREALVSFLNRD